MLKKFKRAAYYAKAKYHKFVSDLYLKGSKRYSEKGKTKAMVYCARKACEHTLDSLSAYKQIIHLHVEG